MRFYIDFEVRHQSAMAILDEIWSIEKSDRTRAQITTDGKTATVRFRTSLEAGLFREEAMRRGTVYVENKVPRE